MHPCTEKKNFIVLSGTGTWVIDTKHTAPLLPKTCGLDQDF